MLFKKFLRIGFLCFALLVFLYLILLTFFNDNFISLKENSFNDNVYKIYYINLLEGKTKDLANDAYKLQALLEKNKADIYVIRSKDSLKDLSFKNYYSYTNTLSSTLTIFSKYDLYENQVQFDSKFFNPAFTGYIKFPNKKVLFSFLSTSFLPKAYESKKFRKYLMLRGTFTELRYKKHPILFIANWDINFFTLRRWLHYLQVRPQNHIYDLKLKKDDLQVFKSTNSIKVFSVDKDNLGIKIVFNVE